MNLRSEAADFQGVGERDAFFAEIIARLFNEVRQRESASDLARVLRHALGDVTDAEFHFLFQP